MTASASRAAGRFREDRLPLALALVALLIAALIPVMGATGFAYRTLTSMFLLIVTAQGWNLIGGYTGYASFGNVAFFGLGAYTTAILMDRLGLPFLITLPVAGLIAALYAVLLGLPVLRLRGHYFAIATLGVAEATREVLAWATPITSGASGISLPFLKPIDFAQNYFYYMTLGLVVLVMGLTWFLSRQKLGYSWAALRADEDGAKMLGVNTTSSKVIAFALAAMVTGLAGSFYAYYNSFIAPEEVFNIDRTLQAILASVLGGAGTVAGPVVGGVLFALVNTFLIFGKPFGIDLGQFHVTLLGIFIVLVIVFTPRGVIDLFARSTREAIRAQDSRGQGRLRRLLSPLTGGWRAAAKILAQNVRQFRV
ncbi:MAG: branched-chain amino acid ABC transporter permease [Chloroflexota bacterium]